MLHTLLSELKRMWFLIAIAVGSIIYFGDYSQLQAQMYIQSTIALIIMMAHITRKALFPYFKLEDAVNRAHRTPIAASISILSMFILLSVIIYVSAK